MPIQIANLTPPSPVFLAPLAGITDLPYRRQVAAFGAGLVVSEMVASQEVVQARPEARSKAEICGDLETSSVQIAGREPYWMAEAAKYVAGQGARIVDINMGCPAKKVVNGYSGSALMREPEHALRIIEAVAEAVDVPVTVKMRLGWDDNSHTAPQLAKSAEDAGLAMVTVHGRTRCQFYKGHANWAAIAPVVEAVNIPVIANGDIVDTATAREALRLSGAAGVMVGRGAQGRPWRLAQIDAGLRGAPEPEAPRGADLVELVQAHHAAMVAFYGAELGLKCARKHLGWYMDDAGTPKALRREVLTADGPRAVERLLPLALAEHSAGMAA